jgi:hypothetical protein
MPEQETKGKTCFPDISLPFASVVLDFRGSKKELHNTLVCRASQWIWISPSSNNHTSKVKGPEGSVKRPVGFNQKPTKRRTKRRESPQQEQTLRNHKELRDSIDLSLLTKAAHHINARSFKIFQNDLVTIAPKNATTMRLDVS